jgi:hypothetical protein
MTLDARFPVALLPIRLETRFAGTQLKVRVYPDEIFGDTHETGLTAEERADGAAYVTAMQAGIGAEREAWRAMVSRWTAPRAAFIALAVLRGSTETREESWSRAAQAMLPDRWVVRAYQGATVFTKTSAPVKRPLALTFSPTVADADRVPLSDNISIDADLQWTVDYAAAEAAGMAVTIDLGVPDLVSMPVPPEGAGVDLLLVVGVSESLSADDGAAQIRDLLDAHHYTRGVAFLRPGTPTNNTPDALSAFPPPDPNGAVSFATERSAPLVTPATSSSANGMQFARALGLTAAAGEQVAGVEHMEGAAVDGDAAASAMNDALWPATLGYFMEQMMTPRFDAATIASARQFFVGRLRAGGPLPAFRVGRVPYGVLPAVSLARFSPESQLARTLRTLRDNYFVPAALAAPRVVPDSTDPDGDLLRVLGVDASCQAVRMRILLGNEASANTAGLLGQAAALEEGQRRAGRTAVAGGVLAGVGLAGDARVAGLDPGQSFELIGAPLVTAGRLSEDFGLEGASGTGINYIRWLHDNASTNVDAIKKDELPGRARPMLYRVLRHALLVEMDRLAFNHLLETNAVEAADRLEAEMVRLAPDDARLTTYDRISRVVMLPTFSGDLSPYLARLATLAALPTAELHRRFGETFDACSHRLDAWITALASQRLATMRETAPSGCHLGGFGWAENVRPASPRVTLGGFVHAPSTTHASAAAILRNGFLSRNGEGSAYAVDLSSARVRDALSLIDGTRQGEPLSALLGYRFERDLHERQLEPLIAPLRGHFPLVAGKTPQSDGPTALVGARNVVDGLALRLAWNDKTAPFSGPSDLPPLPPEKQQSFQDALDALNGCVDGLADVLTAESVFQAVRGNPAAAAASLDAMASGTMPPTPEVVRTPLSGRSFTQRLVVALGGGAVPGEGEWGARTPRAAAEPYLDDWAGTLLGPPIETGCTVRLADGSVRRVTLNALALRPLDLIVLARTTPSGAGDSEVDRRVLAAVGAPAGARIDYAHTTAPRTFTEVLELARTIGELFAVIRPLSPGDLVSPIDAARAKPGAAEAQDAAARADAAVRALADAASALEQSLAAVSARLTTPDTPPSGAEIAALRGALQRASMFGVIGAYPASDTSAGDLAGIAGGALQELMTRLAAAPALDATDPAALVAEAANAMQAVFGRDFVFLPTLVASLATALAASPALVGDDNLPRQAVQQMARVRPSIGRWRSMWLYGQALGADAPALEVVQVPTAAMWAGRPGATVAPATVSLIVHRPTNAPAESGWAGFVIDEWNETIPSAVQPTALSFRYETPIAEAPQAVLLAVPPTTEAAEWDAETLFDTVRETLLLAKVRAVDSTMLSGLGQFLPAIFLTGNTANEVVSTNLLTDLIAEPTIRSA